MTKKYPVFTDDSHYHGTLVHPSRRKSKHIDKDKEQKHDRRSKQDQ